MPVIHLLRLLRLKDEIGDFAHRSFATFFLADVPDRLLHLRMPSAGQAENPTAPSACRSFTSSPM
ncbi:MAG: hypothetical protein MRJ92_12840 [Nitrospira sp.]|nr:hypothetical protein [Nitrospira sp.]